MLTENTAFRFTRQCETCPASVSSNRKDRRFCDRCLQDRANALTRKKRMADRRAAGAAVKTGSGICGCGKVFARRTHNRSRCDDCRPRTLPPTCQTCAAPRPANKLFCAECRKARDKAKNTRDAQARARRDGKRAIGSEQPCADCSTPFVLTAGAQVRCLACRGTYMARWQQNRRQTCAKAAMTDRVRRGINSTLGKGSKARRSWEALVGWTKADLVAHLERQFVGGMTWENRDRWDIDHVVPLKSFRYTTAECPDFRAAWALSNLRPLWKPENATKQGRRTHLL